MRTYLRAPDRSRRFAARGSGTRGALAAAAVALLLTTSFGCSESALLVAPSAAQDGLNGYWSGTAADGRSAKFTVVTEGYVTYGIGHWDRDGTAFAALGPWRGPALLAVGQQAPEPFDLAYGAGALTLVEDDDEPSTPSTSSPDQWRLSPGTGIGPGARGPWSGHYRGEGLDLLFAQSGSGEPSAGGGRVGGQSVAVACGAPVAGSARCALLWPDGSRAFVRAHRDGDDLLLDGLGPQRRLQREAP